MRNRTKKNGIHGFHKRKQKRTFKIGQAAQRTRVREGAEIELVSTKRPVAQAMLHDATNNKHSQEIYETDL